MLLCPFNLVNNYSYILMLKHKIILLSLTFFVSFNATAIEHYISSDLSVYVRRGPSTQYGLIGTLKAGDPITVLEKSSDGKFTRIQDAKGRISWLESNLISTSPSLKEQVPQLESEIADLKEKIIYADKNKQTVIEDYTNKLKTASDKIATLEKERSDLKNQVNEQAKQIQSLNNIVDENRQDLMLTWFTRGGLVAGVGLLLGLLLPIIIPRRRNKDRWMR